MEAAAYFYLGCEAVRGHVGGLVVSWEASPRMGSRDGGDMGNNDVVLIGMANGSALTISIQWLKIAGLKRGRESSSASEMCARILSMP